MSRWILALLVLGGVAWLVWGREAGAAQGDPAPEPVSSEQPLRGRLDLGPAASRPEEGPKVVESGTPATAPQTSGPGPSAVFAANLPTAGIESLGSDNAFLHQSVGRSRLAAVLQEFGSQDDETAARSLTKVLELGMRGRLENQDAEALAAFASVEAALQARLRKTVFNPSFLARARRHKVERGETLDVLARRFSREHQIRLEAGTLALVNGIADPSRLRADQTIKVPLEPIRTVVEKRSFTMAVYLGDVIVRCYRVGLGKDDSTPAVTFTIGDKKEKPDWFHNGRVIPYGHPDNVLGDYFVKFLNDAHPGYGAHGTTQPETIGTMASLGCIRMHDRDIRDFFALVPRGSTVEIR